MAGGVMLRLFDYPSCAALVIMSHLSSIPFSIHGFMRVYSHQKQHRQVDGNHSYSLSR